MHWGHAKNCLREMQRGRLSKVIAVVIAGCLAVGIVGMEAGASQGRRAEVARANAQIVEVRSSGQRIVSKQKSKRRRDASQPSVSTSVSQPGLVKVNDSKTNCIYTGSSGWVAQLRAAEKTTGIEYNCVETFSTTDSSWAQWTSPWLTHSFGFSQWLAADSSNRTIILTQQLIPDAVCAVGCSDPLAWEEACDAGAYNGYATQLASELVSSGFGNSVIRLGSEMNGAWENDYAGSTTQEQQDWARCFSQEVSAMRAVPGSHLLIDWDVNACFNDYSLSTLYPGNSSVNIVGVDAYDFYCQGGKPTVGTAASFSTLASAPDGLLPRRCISP
jgi:hypothetical protein